MLFGRAHSRKLMSMQRVCILETGGTIGQIEPLSKLVAQNLKIDLTQIFNKDSNNVGPNDWVTIAQCVVDTCKKGVDGIVITHGTATLGFTAAALSFMIKDLPVPIAITGSMIPGSYAETDAISNLQNAIALVSDSDLAEVCVVFSQFETGQDAIVIRGTRCRKISGTRNNAFRSVNLPEIGYVKNGEVTLDKRLIQRRRSSTTPYLQSKLNSSVALVKMHPALTATSMLTMLRGMSGAVIEAYGSGQIRTDDSDFLATISQFEKPLALSSQCWFDGVRLNPDMFKVDRTIASLPNVIPVGDMLSEVALVKLMWILGNGWDARDALPVSVCGELSL